MNTPGSIFVCFLCEAEYKDVDLLNDHMKQHDDMPGESCCQVNLITVLNL